MQPYQRVPGSHRVSMVMIDTDKLAIVQNVNNRTANQSLSHQQIAHISMEEILKHFKHISEVEKKEFLEKVLNDVLGKVTKEDGVRPIIIEEALRRVSPGVCGCECVIL